MCNDTDPHCIEREYSLLHEKVEMTTDSVEDYTKSWQDAIKLATDQWLAANWRWMGKICLAVQRQYHLDDVWEDLRSDCVVAVYKYANNWQPNGSLGAYLYVYIKMYPYKSQVLNKYRSKCNQLEDDIPQEIVTTSDESSDLRSIAALPVHERMYLQMKYLGNLNNCEMARAMGVSECTVRYQLNRILNKIKVKGT